MTQPFLLSFSAHAVGTASPHTGQHSGGGGRPGRNKFSLVEMGRKTIRIKTKQGTEMAN